MIVHSCLRVSINLNMPPSDEEGGFCVAKDGGRENALIKPFPTTPQSAPQTAPLTRGAEKRLFRQTKRRLLLLEVSPLVILFNPRTRNLQVHF